MTNRELEARLIKLEAEVQKLREEARSSKTTLGKDWRRTIGAFTGDEAMQEILRDAIQMREADRAATRESQPPQGNSRTRR